MRILRKEKCKSIEEYLGQFDFHSHAFSHCVVKKDFTDDEMKVKDEKQKLNIFSQNLEKLCTGAIQKRIRGLGVTDHPQFLRYGLKFEDYKRIFEEKADKHKKDLILVGGIEMDIEPNESKIIKVNTDIVTDGNVGIEEIGKSARYFICSLHYKNFKNYDIEKNKESYIELIKLAINSASEFKQEMQDLAGRKRVVILGHPYCIIGETNDKEYRRRVKDEEGFKENFPTIAHFLSSNECPIQRFDDKELDVLTKMLLKNEIYIETNGLTIGKKGFSDIRKTAPFHRTIAGAYISYCINNKITPHIFINSDAHSLDDLGGFELNTIKNAFNATNDKGLLDAIKVPYYKILR